MDKSRFFVSVALLLVASLCRAEPDLNPLAERYVRLSLEMGTHEAGYIDAYIGDPQWKIQAETQPRGIPALKQAMDALSRDLGAAQHDARDPAVKQRARTLSAYVASGRFRLDMMEGQRLPFVDEAEKLFGIRPQLRPLESYDAVLARLDRLVPGPGTLAERIDAFQERYTISADRLLPVLQAGIAECRRRTAQHIALPSDERFDLELVKDKSWSAYNWYRGGNHSLIQVNAGLPVRIGSAITLGCHEGYPGHHVQGLRMERMFREQGWVEYSVMPLFSPMGVLNEGGGNHGVELAFPGRALADFEREVLFPMAGLDPSTAGAYAALREALRDLGGATLTINQQYLDGSIDRARAIELHQRYGVTSRARAERSVAFADQYRSYVINYSTGEDIVRAHVRRSGTDVASQWRAYEEMISRPTLPGDLLPTVSAGKSR